MSDSSRRHQPKEPFPDGRKLFYTVRVDPALADKLSAHGVKVTGASSNNLFSTILSWVLPIFVFYLIWTYGIRRMAERQGLGGLMTIGKSRAKVYVETDTKVTFRDVAGVAEWLLNRRGIPRLANEWAMSGPLAS